ncbi:MAG: ATP-dependent metallopeptidase FtsH/Yme1/Tma family protein, partial [Alphaproteobacteria bacterium]
MNLFSRNLAVWIFIIILLIALFNLFQGSSTRPVDKPIAYSEFITDVEAGLVSNVTLQGRKIFGTYKENRGARVFETLAPEDPNLVAMLQKNGVQIRVEEIDTGPSAIFQMLI